MEKTEKAKIAGVFKYPAAKPAMKTMVKGERFYFEKEPTNPYDPNAIALFVMEADPFNDIHNPGNPQVPRVPIKCGYLPRTLAESLKVRHIVSIVKGDFFDEVVITSNGE